MANLMLLICVVLAGASLVSFTAAAGYGESWATDVCYVAPIACGNPQAMAFSAAGFGFLWLLTKFVAALRG